MDNVLTFKAFNEICDVVMEECCVSNDVAVNVASKIFDIVQNDGMADYETAEKGMLDAFTQIFGGGI